MNSWLPETTEHYVELPGLRMHYIAAGPEDGYPVILLHGFPEFWYSWRFQIPALAEAGYRVIAPDQRGYNLTDTCGPYDLATLTTDLVNLQEALGVSESHVVGHDWGATVAWAFAAACPDRVGRLAIMNGPHPNAYLKALARRPVQIAMSWYMYFFQLPWLPEFVIRLGNYRVVDYYFGKVGEAYMTDEDRARYKAAFNQPGTLSAMIGWYRALPRQMMRNGGSLPHPAIRMPTLVIWGERDPVLHKACNDALPDFVDRLTVHYVPEGSHAVQMDHPDEVNSLLLDFFGSHEGEADHGTEDR